MEKQFEEQFSFEFKLLNKMEVYFDDGCEHYVHVNNNVVDVYSYDFAFDERWYNKNEIYK